MKAIKIHEQLLCLQDSWWFQGHLEFKAHQDHGLTHPGFWPRCDVKVQKVMDKLPQGFDLVKLIG